MMDDNFQTICEDNSPEEVGSVLCDYFSKYKSEEKEKVDAELGIVKNIYSSNCSLPAQNEGKGMSVDEGGDCAVAQVNTSDCDSQTMELDGEWTVVRNRRRI
ncbi:hypothetical protein J437_LFUL000936 [Ladona fulva]|uniref:Uncharacterized protein n=1 Tax=Ladona fulva TaxID=123851 RepID=A0A8K0NYS8_LADFU|nr:hypothetical protein J437_LFUL000936 [Ladona fulva]